MTKKRMTAAELQSLGGKGRTRNLTPEQLSEIGRKGAAARWAKARAKEKENEELQQRQRSGSEEGGGG